MLELSELRRLVDDLERRLRSWQVPRDERERASLDLAILRTQLIERERSLAAEEWR